MIPWPEGTRPETAALFVETLLGRFDDAYTGYEQLLVRPHDPAGARLAAIASVEGILRQIDRWIGDLTLDLDHADAAVLNAFLARLRGRAGVTLVPAWPFRQTPAGTLASMDEHAATIGPTSWDDATGFDDDTSFVEGAGVPTLLGGRGQRFAIGGFAPFTAGVLATGDLIQAGVGRGHQVTEAGTTDHNGYLAIWAAPTARDPVPRETLVTTDVAIAMRLAGDDGARGQTRPPCRTRYRVRLTEAR